MNSTIAAPPPVHIHHPHHPGGGGGFRPGPGAFRRGPGWGPGWWGAGPYYDPGYATPVYTTSTCSAWGNPVTLTAALADLGNRLLEPSGGQQPASDYYGGVLYLFAVENGVMTARPCAARSSTLSGPAAPAGYGWRAGYPIAGVSDAALPRPPLAVFLYKLVLGVWTPLTGEWTVLSDAAAMDRVKTILSALFITAPTTPMGGWVWDGQSMKFQSTLDDTLRL